MLSEAWSALTVSVLRRFPEPARSFTLAELGPQTAKPEHLVAKVIAAGLIERENISSDRLQVTSEVAYQALQSLALLCEQLPKSAHGAIMDLPNRTAWTIEDLFQLESQRVAAAEAAGIDPKPLRWQASVLVIVKAHRSNEDVYLLAQRPGWEGFGLIGGKFDPHLDRSLADTARRELAEELDLSPGEFRVEPLPIRPAVVKAISHRLGVLTEYRFRFFQLFAVRSLRINEGFSWFGRESVYRGETVSGEPLNHLAYPEVHRALWEELPGGLDGLSSSLPSFD